MRRWIVLVLLLALARGAHGAPTPEGPVAEALSDDEAADAAVAAVRAKDAASLKTLAESDVPDPWRVADLLGARSEWAVAAALAQASPRAAAKALAAYVASRQGKDPEAPVRKALADSDLAAAAGELAAALATLDGVAAKGDSVLAAELGVARGDLLTGLERHEEAARAYAASAEIAARIGWAAQAGAGYLCAGRETFRRSDYRGAQALWEKALPFVEAGSDRTALAGTLQNLASIARRFGDAKRALTLYERALSTWDAADQANVALTLACIGGIHVDLGDLDRALEYHTRALRLREEVGSPGEIGGALASLGTIHETRGDFPAALETYTRALALQRGANDPLGTGRTLASLGVVRAHLGETTQALALEEEARALLATDEETNRAELARIALNVGWIHYERGDYGRALDVLTKVRAVTEEVGEVRLEAIALATLGAVHVRLGDYAKAMGLLVRARKAMAALSDRSAEAEILAQIGVIHGHLGEFAKALETEERARRLAEDVGNRAAVATTIVNVAGVYLRLGDVRKSIELNESASALFEKVGRRADVAVCRGNIGLARAGLEDYEGALAEHAKALAILEALGSRPAVAQTLSNMADVRVREGKPKEALVLLERAQRIRGEIKDRSGLAAIAGSFGDAWRALADPKKALGFYERAALDADRLGDLWLLVDALNGAAQAHLDLGEPALALEKAKRAASYVERLTQGQGEAQGASAREQYVRLYDAGTRAAALLDDVGQAAFFIETGRAGTLLESLGGRETLRSWSLSPELLDAQTKARAVESAALRAYADVLEAGALAPIRARKAELDAARAALQEVIERITRESKSAIIVYPKAATLDEMQGGLEPHDALVLYRLLPDDAVALVMTPDVARLVRLGKTSEVAAACAAIAPSDPASSPTQGLDALRALVASKLDLPASAKRVLVSSDGALSYVPFSLLFPGRLVAYVPSGTAYGELREDGRRKGVGVLALGDPDYRGADPKAVALLRAGPRLSPLPNTRLEAEAVGDVRLLGPDATASSLAKAVAGRPRWHAVHLGCHGLVDPENPMRCSLALTPEAGGTGLLLAQDVGLLRMPTDLAVLSACETMKGRIYRGEGIVGIARMFMYAGAPRLLTSLWKVDDDATRALMIRFYEVWNPKDGSKPLGTAEALAAAQAHVRGQEKWKHPYYWAAWVLWGVPD